jgi:AcrR family transcriptional regulator
MSIVCQVTNSLSSDLPPAGSGRSRGNVRRGADKRERLVAAARRVMYEQGVETTTLAHIAAAADVPLGNVYYYFKTKDALVSAVIESYRQSYGVVSAELAKHDSPVGRLKALVQFLTSRRDQLATYGCPIGSLNSELDKREDALRSDAATILAGLIDWPRCSSGRWVERTRGSWRWRDRCLRGNRPARRQAAGPKPDQCRSRPPAALDRLPQSAAVRKTPAGRDHRVVGQRLPLAYLRPPSIGIGFDTAPKRRLRVRSAG